MSEHDKTGEAVGPRLDRGVVPASPGARRNAARRMTAARDFPANTCGASRHAQQLAEVLMSDKPLRYVTDDRHHSGESIAATVEALWKLRSAALRMLAALDKLDEGCREPGFRGWENGNGVRCGDEAERARKALARLVRGHNVEVSGCLRAPMPEDAPRTAAGSPLDRPVGPVGSVTDDE